MAQGYGYWQQGQDPDVLEVYPAQELFRRRRGKKNAIGASRQMGVGAPQLGRWEMKRRCVVGASTMAEWSRGRIRRSGSALSRFGQPYPPFDFNSGMDIRDVDRETAVELGVIGENDRVQPQSREFAQAA
jgi:hypothetical protein